MFKFNNGCRNPRMAVRGIQDKKVNPPRRVGISDPISVAEPSESDIIKSKELEKFIADSGLFESKEEAIKREEVLGRLDEVVKLWVKNVTRAKGFNDQVVEESNAKIFTSGSYRLGVHGPGADIDTLCVGPRYATREDFFGELHNMLAEMPEVQELNPVPDAYVPVLKFKFDGVSIDLLYASLDLWVIPEDLDLLQDSVLRNVDEQTARSLNGCRVTDQILRLVPNIQNFLSSLRCIRFWAKQRGIYSNVSGFLGGINWAILVGWICQLYPKALPAMLVSRFFRIYSQWKWPRPIMLCEIKEGLLGLPVWNPKWNLKDRQHLMPIITPAYPSMNSSYNVSSSTLRIMQQEFQRGLKICEELETSHKADWNSLFEPFAFFEAYKDYLKIDIGAGNEVDFRQWKGWVQSRIRLLTLKIERDTRAMLQCHPYPTEFSDNSKKFQCCFFMGLKKQEGFEAKDTGSFDLRCTIQQFKYEVGSSNICRHGMSVHVSYVRSRDLPAFVFPGGIVPSRPVKAASKRKASGISPTDKPNGGRRIKLDTSNTMPRASTPVLTTEQNSMESNASFVTSPSCSSGVEELEQGNSSIVPLSSTSSSSSSSTSNSSSSQEASESMVLDGSGDQAEASGNTSSRKLDHSEEVASTSRSEDSDQKMKVSIEKPFVVKLATATDKANGSCCEFLTNRDLEELEPPTPWANQSCAIASNIPAQKPLIRFNFTSLRGMTST